MALTADISADDGWYLGEDKKLRFAVYVDATQAAALDVSAFALSWQLAPNPGDTPVLTKTTAPSGGIAVTGVFNASPALNTQRIEVTILDTDTDGLQATVWSHELKRTDSGLEGVLAHGYATLLQPVHAS